MSTSPAENPIPGIVTFTPHGTRVLDRLAASLVDECDGSPASIANVLERVLSVDIEQLADALTEAAGQLRANAETGPAPESPDQAARRRLAPGCSAVDSPAGQAPSLWR